MNAETTVGNKNPPRTRRRSPRWWRDALAHLSQHDAVMAEIIPNYSRSRLYGSRDPYRVLANSIIGQQISVKAADSIRQRIEEICPLDSKAIIKIPMARLQGCGLSKPKVDYLISLARWFDANDINAKWFSKHPSETVYQHLIAQRGIGEWTWNMFAIFYLMESDVLPRADVGLWKGVEKAYGVGRDKVDKKIDRLEKIWSPYCTAAVWFMWCSLDPKEIVY